MKRSEFIIRMQNNLLLLTGVALLLIFIGYTIWNDQGLIRLFSMRSEIEKLNAANRALLIKNFLAAEEVQNLKKKSVLEQRARSELGYVRKDEVIYIIE